MALCTVVITAWCKIITRATFTMPRDRVPGQSDTSWPHSRIGRARSRSCAERERPALRQFHAVVPCDRAGLLMLKVWAAMVEDLAGRGGGPVQRTSLGHGQARAHSQRRDGDLDQRPGPVTGSLTRLAQLWPRRAHDAKDLAEVLVQGPGLSTSGEGPWTAEAMLAAERGHGHVPARAPARSCPTGRTTLFRSRA